jgi:hypothetical protein
LQENIVIPAKDSIYVFAEVTIDPNRTENPFVIDEKLIVEVNGNQQSMVLEAWGQNANYIPNNLVKGKIATMTQDQFWNDPKSRLQQCCLSLRDVDESKPSLPIYKLVEEKGPPNNKQYRVAVYFNRKRLGEGLGKSIHDAEVEAAKNALKKNAKMFPILNKYIADEFKMSKYFPSSVKPEQLDNQKNIKQEVDKDDEVSRADSQIKKKKS